MAEYWNRWWTQRASRRRMLAGGGAAAAGVAGLALVGCGDDDDDTGGTPAATGTTAATGTAAASATATAAAAKPVKGGTIRYPLEGISSGDPPTLFPYENLTYLVQNPSSLHYSRLLRQKSGPDISSTNFTSLEGDVAQKWEQPDDLTHIFTLKPNLKWQNLAPMNGRAMTAPDIVKSYDAFLAKSQQANGWKAVVDSIEATDEKTLKVKMLSPFAPFLVTNISNPEHFWLIPVETIDNDQVKTQPVGSGPWIFDDYETGVAMRWVKNPDFVDIAEFPHFDKVEASLLKDPQRLIQAMQAGDFDHVQLSGTVYTDAHAKADPKGREHFSLSGHGGFWFNFDNQPWRDPRVRQALSNAMDRAGILKAVDQTGKGDANSHLSVGLDPFWMSPLTSKEWGDYAKYWKYDPAESKKLLMAATGSDTLKVTLIANVDRYGAAMQQMAELLQSTMKPAGFEFELQYMEYATYIQSIFLGKIPEGAVAAGPYIGTVRDPDNIYFSEMHTSAPRHNWGGTPLPEQAEFDAAFEKQRTILNKDERIKFIKDLQRRQAEVMERVPYVQSAGFTYTQPWLQNYNHVTGYAVHTEAISKSWFTEERAKKG
ncbi:MAG: ABC transporter substrate-binding protein [Dehalococcoidia bacterium]